MVRYSPNLGDCQKIQLIYRKTQSFTSHLVIKKFLKIF
jgi:hypothetical protein